MDPNDALLCGDVSTYGGGEVVAEQLGETLRDLLIRRVQRKKYRAEP